jgi:Methyltransferase domain
MSALGTWLDRIRRKPATTAAPGGDVRDAFLAEVVKDRSFAEVGGLWGAVNEKVSVAHRAGATSLTMIDVMPPEDEWWGRFRERIREHGVARYETHSGDVATAPLGPFDVIHCSGVLYHVPHPIDFLARIRDRLNEHLVLSSAVIPRRIENQDGVLEVPEGGALFVPSMDDAAKRVYTRFWQGDSDAAMWGVNRAFDHFTLDNYVPWWWLMTVSAIRGMARVAGFEVVRDAPLFTGGAHTLLLRKR